MLEQAEAGGHLTCTGDTQPLPACTYEPAGVRTNQQ